MLTATWLLAGAAVFGICFGSQPSCEVPTGHQDGEIIRAPHEPKGGPDNKHRDHQTVNTEILNGWNSLPDQTVNTEVVNGWNSLPDQTVNTEIVNSWNGLPDQTVNTKIVNSWNGLPDQTVNAETLDHFMYQ
ncbi:hypothetical protein LSAT2_009934, partial [Lamellibrachia satsuma]